MGGALQFVNHSHGIVLHGDVAGAGGGIDDEVVLAETELARTLPLLLKRSGGGAEYPVEIVLAGQVVEIEVTQGAHTVHNLGRDGAGVDDAQAGLDEERTRTADDEQTTHAALLDSLDDLGIVSLDEMLDVGISPAGIVSRDDGILALGDGSDGSDIVHVLLDGREPLLLRQLGGMTHDGRHLMTAGEEFTEDSRTYKTSCTNQYYICHNDKVFGGLMDMFHL